MPASNLIEHVSELIAAGQELVPVELRPKLDDLERRLREPVRVAVVGRVNAGKSTLVNALLAQRVAPTDISECTRLVTWFHYGHPQRLEVELVDGSRVDTQLGPDGLLPNELGLPVKQVKALHCYLANDTLRWMTLIDTPGIGSVHEEYSQLTEDLLGVERDSADAAQHADAVVFLMNQVMMEDELQALQMFRNATPGDGETSAANAVGLLSKADQLGDGTQDPWGVALELAGIYAGKFRDEVAAVVPVIGLVAETAETATLSETDTRQLGELSAMEPKRLERLLWSADRFIGAEAPIPPEEREALLAKLDLYGIQRAVSFMRDGVTGAVALRRELSTSSGIAEVKRTLATYFHEQDHVLKVRSALQVLERLTYTVVDQADQAGLLRFRGMVEKLHLDAAMHQVNELQAWHDCCTGRVTLDPEQLAEVERLFAPGTAARKLGHPGAGPAELREAAKANMTRWRGFMVTNADPSQAKLARVVLRSYQQLWTDLKDPA
jgi:tRNA U34 5-carboxymethylaminomethyl modifying GTPase MnmE/TrmE